MTPAQADVKAVHAVLNEEPRKRQVAADIKSIDVLMGRGPSSSGQGPTWYYADSGDLTSSVIEAARRARQISTALQGIAAEIERLSIPADDRGDLVTAFRAQAASWDARAAAWTVSGKPHGSSAVDAISRHQRNAFEAAQKVKAYLEQAR